MMRLNDLEYEKEIIFYVFYSGINYFILRSNMAVVLLGKLIGETEVFIRTSKNV